MGQHLVGLGRRGGEERGEEGRGAEGRRGDGISEKV